LNGFAKVKFHNEFFRIELCSWNDRIYTQSHYNLYSNFANQIQNTKLKCGDRPIKRLAGPYLQQLKYVTAGNPFPLATEKVQVKQGL